LGLASAAGMVASKLDEGDASISSFLSLRLPRSILALNSFMQACEYSCTARFGLRSPLPRAAEVGHTTGLFKYFSCSSCSLALKRTATCFSLNTISLGLLDSWTRSADRDLDLLSLTFSKSWFTDLS